MRKRQGEADPGEDVSKRGKNKIQSKCVMFRKQKVFTHWLLNGLSIIPCT